MPRCWTYETSIIAGVELDNNIPENDYRVYFAPEYKIHMQTSNMENQNSSGYLEKITQQILKNLESVNRPGVQLNVNGNQPIKLNVN